jgi:predicted AlkP superfamily phosphohydrolase/phosphomutase
MYGKVLKKHYLWIDGQIGQALHALDDQTALLIYSDYSIQRVKGFFHLNEWLIKEGYLALREYPSEPVPFHCLPVDWGKTRAWVVGSSGGIRINVLGREAEGIVGPEDYDLLLEELISRMKRIPDDKGNELETRLFKRHEIYSGPFADDAPDLFLFLDGCRWKVDERVGFGSGNFCSKESIHFGGRGGEGFYGYFSLVGPGIPSKGEYEGASLIDLAPTVLDVLDLEIHEDLEGISLSGKERTREEQEAMIEDRLKFLGY